MKPRLHIVLALLSLAIIVVLANHVTAQELTVSTDKTLYLPGEVVIISGTAAANQLVGISIYNPSGIELDFRMVRSGSDGKYRVEVLLPSKLGEPPYENWIPGVYTVRAWVGSTFVTTKFELIPGAKITGVIADINDNPLANAIITVKELGISTRSGVDGTFTLYVKPGTYTLTVSKEGYRSVEIKVDVAQYENNIGVIKLAPGTVPTITTPATVTVTVTQTVTSPLTITETQTEIQTTAITQTKTEVVTKTVVETTVSPTTTTLVRTLENTVTATKTEIVTTIQTLVSTLTLERTAIAYVTTTSTLTSVQPDIGLTIGVGVALLVLGLAIGWLVLGKGLKSITERSK